MRCLTTWMPREHGHRHFSIAKVSRCQLHPESLLNPTTTKAHQAHLGTQLDECPPEMDSVRAPMTCPAHYLRGIGQLAIPRSWLAEAFQGSLLFSKVSGPTAGMPSNVGVERPWRRGRARTGSSQFGPATSVPNLNHSRYRLHFLQAACPPFCRCARVRERKLFSRFCPFFD